MEWTLPENLKERVRDMAEYREMTEQAVIEEALQEFFAYTDVLTHEVEEAVAEADREGWLSTEEVFAAIPYLHKQPA